MRTRSVVSAGAATVVGAAAVLVPIQQAPPALPPVAPDTAIVFGLSSVTLPLPLAARTLPLAARAVRIPEPEPVSDAAPVRPPSNFAEALSPEVAALPGVESAIINVYNAVEPWVEWGFDVAQYAVGWIPIAGYFAPQIGIFYDFFESIVQSVVFNFAYWIGGDVTFFEGLGNIAQDSWNALVQLGVDELNWILPPLPPWPPIFNAAVEAESEASTVVDGEKRPAAVVEETRATDETGETEVSTVADVAVEEGSEQPTVPADDSDQVKEPALDDEQAPDVTEADIEREIEADIETEAESDITAGSEFDTAKTSEPETDAATETAAPDDADADAPAEGAGDTESE